jgi:hypothetical protein
LSGGKGYLRAGGYQIRILSQVALKFDELFLQSMWEEVGVK